MLFRSVLDAGLVVIVGVPNEMDVGALNAGKGDMVGGAWRDQSGLPPVLNCWGAAGVGVVGGNGLPNAGVGVPNGDGEGDETDWKPWNDWSAGRENVGAGAAGGGAGRRGRGRRSPVIGPLANADWRSESGSELVDDALALALLLSSGVERTEIGRASCRERES